MRNIPTITPSGGVTQATLNQINNQARTEAQARDVNTQAFNANIAAIQQEQNPLFSAFQGYSQGLQVAQQQAQLNNAQLQAQANQLQLDSAQRVQQLQIAQQNQDLAFRKKLDEDTPTELINDILSAPPDVLSRNKDVALLAARQVQLNPETPVALQEFIRNEVIPNISDADGRFQAKLNASIAKTQAANTGRQNLETQKFFYRQALQEQKDEAAFNREQFKQSALTGRNDASIGSRERISDAQLSSRESIAFNRDATRRAIAGQTNKTRRDIAGQTNQTRRDIAQQANATRLAVANVNNRSREKVTAQTNKSREKVAGIRSRAIGSSGSGGLKTTKGQVAGFNPRLRTLARAANASVEEVAANAKTRPATLQERKDFGVVKGTTMVEYKGIALPLTKELANDMKQVAAEANNQKQVDKLEKEIFDGALIEEDNSSNSNIPSVGTLEKTATSPKVQFDDDVSPVVQNLFNGLTPEAQKALLKEVENETSDGENIRIEEKQLQDRLLQATVEEEERKGVSETVKIQKEITPTKLEPNAILVENRSREIARRIGIDIDSDEYNKLRESVRAKMLEELKDG